MSKAGERWWAGVFLLLYLFLLFASALFFTGKLARARRVGRAGIGWALMAVLCILLFGAVGLSLVVYSDPSVEAGWYWFGWAVFAVNVLALLRLFRAFGSGR